jgi:hypothetical protein
LYRKLKKESLRNPRNQEKSLGSFLNKKTAKITKHQKDQEREPLRKAGKQEKNPKKVTVTSSSLSPHSHHVIF